MSRSSIRQTSVSRTNPLAAAIAPVAIAPLMDALESRCHFAVTPINHAPQVALTGVPLAGFEGTPINVTASASDVDAGDTLTYGWTVYRNGQHFILPNGTSISGTSLQFTPTDNGNYVTRFTAVDNQGASATVNSAPIVVANVAPAGTISGTPSNAIAEGTPVALSIAATDAGAEDTLNYVWTVTRDGQSYQLPQNAVTNAASFTFTPGHGGTYLATCQVTDDDGGTTAIATSAFTVTNVAPTVSIGGTPGSAIDEGDAVSLTANVVDPGADDTFTYAWSVTKNGQPYNLGTTVANGATFAFAPNDNGSYVVTLNMADDSDAAASATSSAITVNNVAPVAQIAGPLSGQEGTPLNFTAAVTDRGAADTFTYAWSVTKDGNPFPLTNGEQTASTAFSFTPPDNGSYAVSLDVTDKDGASAATVTRTVSVLNVAPWVSIIGVPQDAVEGTSVDLTASALDPGTNDTLTYAWAVTKDGNAYVLPNGTIDNDSFFSFTPDDNGAYVATLTVTDNDGGQSVIDTPITVGNVAPTINVAGEPGGHIDEGASVHLTTNVTDPGWNDTDTYVWTITRNDLAWTPPSGTVLTSDTLDFTPTNNGSYVATATVTDNAGGVGTVDSQVIIVDNVAPTVAITGAPGSAVDEDLPTTFGTTVTDPGTDDTQYYVWSVTKDGNPYTLPNDAIINLSTFTFTPGHSGSYVVSVSVSDQDGGAQSDSTSAITVNNVAPGGAIGSATTGSEGSPITLTANPTDGIDNTFTYAWSVTKDGNPVTLGGSIVSDQKTFTFTPDDQGLFAFTCTVTDDENASTPLTQTVAVANVAPSVAITNPTGATEGSATTVTGVVSDAGVNDTLTYGWTVKKDGVSYPLPNGTVIDAQNLTFTPTDNGAYVATLTAMDGDGGSTTIDGSPFVVGNVAPSISIDDPGTGLLENEPVTLTGTISDPSIADTSAGFSSQWSAERDGQLVASGSDDDFTFVPSVHGTYLITLVVTDKDGGTRTASRNVDIDNVDPTNAAINGLPASMNESQSAMLIGTADDAPDDTLAYAWTVSRNGSPFAQADGDTFNFSPHVRGNFEIKLTATDLAGVTTTQTETINVANLAPTVSFFPPNFTVLLGENAPFKLSMSDVPKNQSLALSIDFGDGVVKQETFTGNQSNLSLNHTYAQAGSYAATVSVSDGVDTSTVTKSVAISRAAVRIDPLDASKTALFVVGSNSADDINVYTSGKGRYGVIYNGQILSSSYYPTGRIVVKGNGGADTIQNNTAVPSLVYSGNEPTTIKGGGGNDILIGGAGADYIDGRGGRDILIGNAGPDTILGGDGDDLILPGIATWASSTATLKSVNAIWNGSGTTSARLALLKTANLFGTTTVIDTASDLLYGQTGNDVFRGLGSNDRVRDFAGADAIN